MMHKLLFAGAALLLPQAAAAQTPVQHYGQDLAGILVEGFMRFEADALGSRSGRNPGAFFGGYGCRPAADPGAVDCLRHVALSSDGAATSWVLREGRFARTGPDGEWRAVTATARQADWRLFDTIERDMGPGNAFYDAASLRRTGSGFAVRYVITAPRSGLGDWLVLWDVPIDCGPAAGGRLPARPGGDDPFFRSRDERHLPVLKRLLCPVSR
jgi:hypothetical protein